MTELSKVLKEALALRGRSTDGRQTFGFTGLDSDSVVGGDTEPADGGSVPFVGPKERIDLIWLEDSGQSSPDWGKWLLHFPVGDYPSSYEYKGLVPMRIVGHDDLSETAFRAIMRIMNEEMFDRFAADTPPETSASAGVSTAHFLTDMDPPLFVRDGFGVDAKDFIEGGELEQIFSFVFPTSHDFIFKVVSYIEDVYMHPMAARQLRLAKSDRVYTLRQILDALIVFHKSLVEPARRNKTLGDILNALSWPFGTFGVEP